MMWNRLKRSVLLTDFASRLGKVYTKQVISTECLRSRAQTVQARQSVLQQKLLDAVHDLVGPRADLRRAQAPERMRHRRVGIAGHARQSGHGLRGSLEW